MPATWVGNGSGTGGCLSTRVLAPTGYDSNTIADYFGHSAGAKETKNVALSSFCATYNLNKSCKGPAWQFLGRSITSALFCYLYIHFSAGENRVPRILGFYFDGVTPGTWVCVSLLAGRKNML